MIAIIDYDMGNTQSVTNALDHIGFENEITRDPDRIANSEKIILPGVGAFGTAMERLQSYGLIGLLKDAQRSGKHILGICLGMQLLGTKSNEHGEHTGLGFIQGDVKKLEPDDSALKLPHIGWNQTALNQESPIFADLPDTGDFYYVHNYSLHCSEHNVIATCQYGGMIVAAVAEDNVYGAQFHPEKSQDTGLSVLKNFCQL